MTREPWRSWTLTAAGGAWGVVVCTQAFAWPEPFPPPIFDRSIAAFPYAAQAAKQALQSIAAALLVLGAAWQVGRWLTARAPGLFESVAEGVQVTLAVGLAALSCLLFAVAAVGFYRPGVVVILLGAAVASRPGELVGAARGLAESRWRLSNGDWSPADVAYAACAAAAVACALVVALAPEIEYDALYYHLWLPQRWLAAGRPIDIVEEYVSLYPLGWELVYGAGISAGGAGAAKLLHFACLPLTGWAAVLLAKRLARSVSMPLVFALVVTAPTVIWEAGTAYVDLVLAWLLALTALALIRFHESGDRRWIFVGGAVMGLSLGVKHLALVALAIFTVLLIVSTPMRSVAARTRRRAIAVFVATALTLAAPWYARAWAASGNPVFPEMYGVFGAQPPERWSAKTESDLGKFKARFGMGRSVGALVLLPWNLATKPARFSGDLGPLFVIMMPLVIFAAERRRLAALASGVLAYVAIWASPISSFQLRFLVPIVPFLAVFAAVGARVLIQSAASVRRGWAVAPMLAILMLLVLNLPPFMPWHGGRPRTSIPHVPVLLPAAVVLGAESPESYLARTLATYRAWRFINEHTPPDAHVLVFAGGDHYYSKRRRLWSDTVIARPATFEAPAGEEARAMRAVRALGLTHVLIDREVAIVDEIDKLGLLSARVKECCLVPLYQDDRAQVYEIRADAFDRSDSRGGD